MDSRLLIAWAGNAGAFVWTTRVKHWDHRVQNIVWGWDYGFFLTKKDEHEKGRICTDVGKRIRNHTPNHHK